jgi:hypothetical protein
MKHFNKIAISYFLLIIPFLLISMAFDLGDKFYHDPALQMLNAVVGMSLLLWLLITIYLSLSLIISTGFREALISKIIRLKERDEREVVQTGIISKKVFFATIAVVSFLFVLSSMQINVHKLPKPNAEGKQHTLSAGLNLSFWSEPPKLIQVYILTAFRSVRRVS